MRPVPGQQLFKSILGVILDPSEDICQIDLRIMAVQFDRFNDGQDIGDALTALVRAGKQPVLAAERNLPNILPISGKKSRFITAGMRFTVGTSGVTTASSAAVRQSSLLSTNPE